jgi:cytochrome P450
MSIFLPPQAEGLVKDFDHHAPALADENVLPAVHTILRERCPVHHTDAHGGYWVVSRYSDVAEVARNTDVFSSAYGVTIPGARPMPGVPANLAPPMMDPPEQTAIRKMLLPWFSPQSAKRREPAIQRLADDLIDAIVDKKVCDLATEFAEPLPTLFMLRLLGIPDELWESLAQIIQHVAHGLADEADGPNMIDLSSWGPALGPVLEIAEQRRVEPKDDLLTHLVQAEVDGEPLNPLQLLALMFTLIGGGIDTTANAIGSAIVHLGRDRELRQRLIENPSLMPHAVEEFFRMWPPFHALARYVKQDCEIGGQPIKAGERILFVLGAANRDENEFERAQTVDIDRQPNRHLTFGTGVHRCIGSNYARSELHIALTRLLARLPNYQLLEEGVELQTDIGMVYGYRSIRAELCPVG